MLDYVFRKKDSLGLFRSKKTGMARPICWRSATRRNQTTTTYALSRHGWDYYSVCPSKILLRRSRASLPGLNHREPRAQHSRGTCGIAGNTAWPTGYTTVPYACSTGGVHTVRDHQDVFHHESTDLNRLQPYNRTMLDVSKVIWLSAFSCLTAATQTARYGAHGQDDKHRTGKILVSDRPSVVSRVDEGSATAHRQRPQVY
jgi:hypothetical protein